MVDPASKSPKGQSKAGEPQGFSEFYELYVRKLDRVRAMRAYARALQRTDAETIERALRAQLPEMREKLTRGEKEFIPHPATWLNNDRWLQEVDASTTNGVPAGALTPKGMASLPVLQRFVERRTS